ncbi:7-cyano-7-deazaguanine synthase [Aquisphaera giovannonii]|uniref:7-cyano-7-deazaguanine synthase n=1 Tax=Aquisphaera giovannonii TaxID=406548 RepID=A0A5B9VY96_9BACT|nr:7-cyano-7-deazaguanine synthase [Aquisphaera giovannonii]QEH33282.1 7-cyano-7-deazaguanine synthase [Aquisphaera giovannonii]
MRADGARGTSAAVLLSGGLDSAVLLSEMRRGHDRIHPLYIRGGLRWEEAELAAARAFVAAIGGPGLEPLTVLEEPVRDVYGDHWSTGSGGVPGAETPDEAVYLPGRNVLLTAKAAVWCRLRGVSELALGSLGSNPFPDSTPGFYRDLESVLGRAMGGSPRLTRPFDRLSKAEVVWAGRDLPLHLTFSCLMPVAGLHCGSCNKCAERREGFRQSGVADRTPYATSNASPRVGHAG